MDLVVKNILNKGKNMNIIKRKNIIKDSLKLIIESGETLEGFPYKIMMGPTGCVNGYIGIPPGHPALNEDYCLEGELYVHGGVTFEQAGKYPERKMVMDNNGNIKMFNMPVLFEAPYYWVGFDTAHYGDGINLELAKKYHNKKSMFSLKIMADSFTGKVWQPEDVLEEILNMSKQLKELENKGSENEF
jgi:hypothetical protein